MLPFNEQMDLIRRGVAEIVSEDELAQRVAESSRGAKPLRIKYGIDPSGKDVHIGHMVPVSKMRDFQDAGHQGVLIIGDYTAQIGDPTGRNESRPSLTKDQVLANAATYVEQLFKVLDPEKTEVRYQSEWFEGFSLIQMIELGQRFTMAQMLGHETFAKRMDEGFPLGLHELMYPMLMAFDSVAVHSDVELGGMEQRFNILQGRDLQRAMGQRPQIAVLSPMLPGLDGGPKMGKSLNNYVGVNDPPADMFGKAMSIRDDLLLTYLTLAAGVSQEAVRAAQARLQRGTNPMEIKRELGRAIVQRYHGAEAATQAEENFLGVFSRKDQLPEDMAEVTLTENPMRILEILVKTESAPSSSEARRLIQQGGVTLDGYRISDPNAEILVQDGAVLKVGKRRFTRLRFGVAPPTK